MAQFPITKTTSHDQPVGNLYATQDGSSNYLFPTWLITSSGVEIGTAASPLYVSPGTGASWAVTGPLTDAQLRASAVPVSLASTPLPTDAATATKQDSQTTHLATLAGAVSGTEVQVDVLTMPTVNVAQSGSWSVAVSSSTLPTGASTAANQATIISSLASIDGHVDGVEGSLASIDAKITAVNTGAVVVASSALPTGAATAARQDTGNASLSSIDAKTPALGQALAAASIPVVLTASQLSTLTPLGTVSVNQNGTWTVGLSAGSNAIGKLAANAGVTIGAVEIAASQTIGLSASTNNIGDVDVLTQPARAATTDTITAKLATDTIQNGTTALTPKYAKISASSSGNNTVVAAVTSKKIRVLGWNLVGNGAVNAKWQDGAGGTDLTGLYYVAAAGGGICVPFNPVGWFETSSNTLLNLNLSGAVAVGGSLCYVEV